MMLVKLYVTILATPFVLLCSPKLAHAPPAQFRAAPERNLDG
jgi:hypothetical protein